MTPEAQQRVRLHASMRSIRAGGYVASALHGGRRPTRTHHLRTGWLPSGFFKYGRRCACPCKRTVQAPAHAAGLAVAVLLNLALLGEFVLDEKCHDSVALIALELEHLPHLLVLNDAAVAAVDLLDCLEDLLEV